MAMVDPAADKSASDASDASDEAELQRHIDALRSKANSNRTPNNNNTKPHHPNPKANQRTSLAHQPMRAALAPQRKPSHAALGAKAAAAPRTTIPRTATADSGPRSRSGSLSIPTAVESVHSGLIASLESDCADYRAEIRALKCELEARPTEDEAHDARAAWLEQRREMEARLADAESRAGFSEELAAGREAKREAAAAELAEARGETEALRAKLADAEARAGSATKRESARASALDEAERRAQAAESRASDLESRLATSESRSLEIESQANSRATLLKEQTARADAAERQLEALEARCEAAETERSRLAGAERTARFAAEAASADLRRVSDELRKVKTAALETETQLRARAEAHARKTSKAKKAEAAPPAAGGAEKISELKAELAKRDAKLLDEAVAKRALEAAASRETQRLSKAQSLLEKSVEALGTTERRAELLEKEASELRANNVQLRQLHEELQTQCERLRAAGDTGEPSGKPPTNPGKVLSNSYFVKMMHMQQEINRLKEALELARAA